MFVSDPVNAVALSPDGCHIATGTGDPSMQEPLHAPAIRIWDATSGQLLVSTKPLPDMLYTTKEHTGDFSYGISVMYAADSGHIVSLQNLGGPVLWDGASGQLLSRFNTSRVPSSYGWSIAIDPDGHRLFSGGGGVHIWNIASGEALLTLGPTNQTIWTVALSADGSRLASGSFEGVKIWNGESAYNLEAENLVESLFVKLYFASDVTEAIRSAPRLDRSVREAALLLVQRMGERSPEWHIQAAWDAVKLQSIARAAIELALRRTQVACDLAPWSWEAFNTLGAVQYRFGAYQEANTALLHAAELRGAPSVTNLAFRAMALNRLGDYKEARSALTEAKRLADDPSTAFGPDVLAIVKEATTAIERQANSLSPTKHPAAQ
jgi:hypothetical protein